MLSACTSSSFASKLLAALLTLSALTGCEDECPKPSVCDVRERSCQKAVMRAVSCMRGGDIDLPKVTVMSEGEFVAFRRGGEEPTPEWRRSFELWNRGLWLFALAPADYTPEESESDAVSLIAAAYFRNTKEIVVVDRGESLATREAVSVFAHEVVHALQDADHDLNTLQDKWGTGFDSSLALRSVIEGEAVLYQNLFSLALVGRSPGDIDWQRYFRSWRADVLFESELDEAPVSMASMRFPYAFGGGLVMQYYLEAGRAGVDALIDAPPRSTREVMFGPVETEAAVESEFLAGAFPKLDESFERIGVVSLGSWITRQHAARMGLLLSYRLEAPQSLLLDAFAVYSDATTGQLVASWRARMEDAPSAATFPGQGVARFDGWSRGADAYFLASDPRLSAPRSIAWTGPPEESGAGDMAAARVLAHPWWQESRAMYACDARVPSPADYRREP